MRAAADRCGEAANQRQGDQSGNSPDATLGNASTEGVSSKVEIRSGDMRLMPFEDQTFDVIVSSMALHNIYR